MEQVKEDGGESRGEGAWGDGVEYKEAMWQCSTRLRRQPVEMLTVWRPISTRCNDGSMHGCMKPAT